VVVAGETVVPLESTTASVARETTAVLSSAEVPRAATLIPMVDATATMTTTPITICRRFNASTLRTIGRSTRQHPNMSDPRFVVERPGRADRLIEGAERHERTQVDGLRPESGRAVVVSNRATIGNMVGRRWPRRVACPA
jgi:outer membrane receptor for monomeric catechols